MADLVQTAASVVKASTALDETTTSGEAITAGMPVYLNTTDSKWYKAQADGTAAESGTAGVRIALNSAPGAGQPITLFRSGQINLGATLTTGQTYVISNNVGAIAPLSDLGTGSYTTILGIALNTSFIQSPAAGPFASGIQRA